MPRKGQAFPIDADWRRRVREAIAADYKSEAAFAKAAKISKSSLSEALNPESKQSTLVPAIHKQLGWEKPRPLLMSHDDEEIMKILGRMDPRDKAALLERALTLEEQRAKRK